MAGLDQSGKAGLFRGPYPRGPDKKLSNADGIGGVVRSLIDHLQDIIRTDEGGRNLNPTGPPSKGQGHFPTAERDLMAWNCDGLQDRTPNHPFRMFIEIGKIVSPESSRDRLLGSGLGRR
jgi:hypothetical protein